jgi:hypothetical protein
MGNAAWSRAPIYLNQSSQIQNSSKPAKQLQKGVITISTTFIKWHLRSSTFSYLPNLQLTAKGF